ncbi:RES family NAD+ phosphorylase [Porifericola rhodea]|uniref:RES family NAD+ phosphorylase n=1 Tax=Porifericola rhodea TaxID=930972 RepID=UPI00266650FF|nr:RES family NAD+ phosphorylase [Porifericola rhodea]WKN29949.1 RES family NAD+ phosphorylase [Porifericola rhodea]
MNLFRITKPKYAQDLSGTEAKLTGGRWNPLGKAVLYTAGSSALGLLEHLTHLSVANLGLRFQLVFIETYNTPIALLEDHFDPLPKDWKVDKALTQEYGRQWIEEQHSPILRVPSLHSPWEYNYLLNPSHPELNVAIVDISYYVHDDRFLKKE